MISASPFFSPLILMHTHTKTDCHVWETITKPMASRMNVCMNISQHTAGTKAFSKSTAMVLVNFVNLSETFLLYQGWQNQTKTKRRYLLVFSFYVYVPLTFSMQKYLWNSSSSFSKPELNQNSSRSSSCSSNICGHWNQSKAIMTTLQTESRRK